MTSYIVSAFSKIGMMAAVVAASLFPTSLSAQDVAGAADAAELALAGETPVLDSGNTAWLIVATVLVLLMSIPGIALFYGGAGAPEKRTERHHADDVHRRSGQYSVGSFRV